MSFKCFSSCVESWSSCLSSSQTLVCTKCSPRTNVGGTSGQTHVSGKQPKLPLFSFSTFHPHAVWTPLITGLVLKTDPVKCFDKPKKIWHLAGSSLLWWMDTMMLVSAAFFATFGVHSVSLFWDDMLSVQLPPATREPADVRPTQPTPADVPQWTLGWRGHRRGARQSDTTDRRRKSPPQKKIGKSHWPWPLCLGWHREILQVCICWVQVCFFFSQKHLLLLSVAPDKPGTFIIRQIIPVTKHTVQAATFFTDWFIVWSIKCPTTITQSPMWCI